MASYTVASGGVAVHAKTLAANTVDTVTFNDDAREIEVVSDGAAAMYVRIDGSAPTVAGPNSFLLPAGITSARVLASADQANTVVTLISSGTPTYSVMRVS